MGLLGCSKTSLVVLRDVEIIIIVAHQRPTASEPHQVMFLETGRRTHLNGGLTSDIDPLTGTLKPIYTTSTTSVQRKKNQEVIILLYPSGHSRLANLPSAIYSLICNRSSTSCLGTEILWQSRTSTTNA